MTDDLKVREEKVRWTCPECGNTQVQNGGSDFYCVCGDGQVARTSDEWETVHTVILEDILEYVDERIEQKERKLEDTPDVAQAARSSIDGRVNELKMLRRRLTSDVDDKTGEGDRQGVD